MVVKRVWAALQLGISWQPEVGCVACATFGLIYHLRGGWQIVIVVNVVTVAV